MKKNYLAAFSVFLASVLGAQEVQELKYLTGNYPTKTEILEAFQASKYAKNKKTRGATKAAEQFVAEDFEGEAIPNTWTLEQAMGAAGWVADTADLSKRWSPTPREGDLWFAVSNDSDNDDGSNSNDASMDYLTTPAFDLSNVSSAAVKVDLFFNPEFSLSTATIEASNDGASWTSIYTVTADTEWQEDIIISLDDFAGQSNIQVRFGHNDGNGFASGFAVDNIDVRESVVDLSIALLAPNFYSKIPQSQVYEIGGVSLAANVTNNEFETATQVALTAGVTDPGAGQTPFNGAISATFDGLQSEDFLFTPAFTQSTLGTYTFDFAVASTEPDDSVADNSIQVISEVNDTLFARDNDDINGSYPIGKGLDIGFGIPFDLYAGNIFTFSATDTITGFQFAFGADAEAGGQVTINLYPVVAGEPDVTSVLATTALVTKTTPAGTPELVTVNVSGGFYAVSALDTLYAAADYPSTMGLSTLASDTTAFTSLNGSMWYLDGGFLTLPVPTEPMVLRAIMSDYDPSNARPDLVIDSLATNLEYSNLPLAQAQSLDFSLDIRNQDAALAEAATASIEVLLDNAPFYDNEVTIGDVNANSNSGLVNVGSFTPNAQGIYAVILSTAATNEESISNNNGLDTIFFAVGDTLYNRANNTLANLFPFGPNTDVGAGPNELTLGVGYEIVTADTLTAISMVSGGDVQVGDQLQINVYANGVPPFTNVIATSDVLNIATAGAGTPAVITFNFSGGLVLAPGNYFFEVEAVATADDQPRQIVLSNGIITEGKAFLSTLGMDFDFATALQTPAVPIMELSFGEPLATGIAEERFEQISLYPNPAQNVLNISNAKGADYRIVDVAGQVVLQGSILKDVSKVDVSNLNTGIYFVEFSNGLKGSKKIIKL